MNIIGQLRNRVGAAIGAVLGGVCFLAMGAFLAFVVSPQQAAEWRRIEGLPEADAAYVQSAATGTEIVISGTLTDNEVVLPPEFVAYEIDRWEVDPPSDSDDSPDGSWRSVEKTVPALTVSVAGGTIRTTNGSPTISGDSLHEEIERGSGRLSDTYNGQDLPDGSQRTQGFYNGDLVTVLGTKASTGDLAPDRLFAGDRVQLVAHIRQGARIAFIAGIAFMACSPIAIVGGVLGALFGRNRG